MPLTAKGETIKEALVERYGEKKGEQVLYAGKNKGTFTGIDACMDAITALGDSVKDLAARVDSYCARQDAIPARQMTIKEIEAELATAKSNGYGLEGGKTRYQALQTALSEKRERGDK